MSQSAVDLNFPCPACGGTLGLSSYRATGPCTHCGAVLEVELSIRTTAAGSGVSAPLRASAGKKFADRRFRPVRPPRPPSS